MGRFCVSLSQHSSYMDSGLTSRFVNLNLNLNRACISSSLSLWQAAARGLGSQCATNSRTWHAQKDEMQTIHARDANSCRSCQICAGGSREQSNQPWAESRLTSERKSDGPHHSRRKQQALRHLNADHWSWSWLVFALILILRLPTPTTYNIYSRALIRTLTPRHTSAFYCLPTPHSTPHYDTDAA